MIGASEIRGVRDQVGGSGVKIRASGFTSSKVPGVKGDESIFTILKDIEKLSQILEVDFGKNS